MCSKGGSPPVPNQTSTAYQSATAPSAFIQPYYQNFVANATNLAQTPFNPAMMGSVAPMTPEQTTAGTQLYNLGLTMGNFDPAQVRAIESPYTEDVVSATQNWFNNQNRIQANDLLSQAIRTGNAFGGDRPGIAEAALSGQQQLAQAPVIAGLRQAGYTQALDEYNRLKQYGIQGAGAAFGWGTAEQQQRQKELDVAQQNAMMASAYPFQLENWYGATLGGVGPLLGSFAQGYTTPPQPNELTQGLGIASSLVGLGTSLFGKRGGTVGRRRPVRRRVGGLVPVVVARRDGGLIPVGGLVRMRNGGLVLVPRRVPPRLAYRQYGGSINLDLSGGAGDNDDNDSSRRGGTTHSFDLGVDQPSIPPAVGGPPDAGKWIQQRMRATQQAQKKKDDNPTANAIDTLGNVATKLAPLALLALNRGGPVITLKRVRGGLVRHYADGDDVDDDEEDTDTSADSDTGDDTVGKGGATALPAAATETETAPEAPPTAPEAPGEPDLRGGYDVPAGVTPQGAGGARGAYAQAGVGAASGVPGGRVGAGGAREIPGLGPPPRTFAQRWAANPFTQMGAAMLMSRSPYFGPGVGAGILAASQSQEAQRKQDLLDAKPQLIDDGKTLSYRVGNKIIPTGLSSPRAAIEARQAARQEAMEKRQLALEEKRHGYRMEEERQRYPQGRPTGRGAGRDYTNVDINAMIKQELDASKDETGMPSISAEQAEYNAIQRYNRRNPTRALPMPPQPAPKKQELAPKVEDTRSPWDKFRGVPDPNSLAERRKRAQTQQAAPAAPAAPAPQQQPQQRPQQRQAAADPIQRMRDAIDQGGDAARQRIIEQARAAIAANPANEAEIRRRLQAAGLELP